MERNASLRKRTGDPARPAKPSFRRPINKRPARSLSQEQAGSASPDRIVNAQQSPIRSDFGHERAKGDALPSPPPTGKSLEDEPNLRHFTVTNVGAGGRLYLQPTLPTHLSSPTLTFFPTSPIAHSADEAYSQKFDWPQRHQSHVSGIQTPGMRRSTTADRRGHVPSASLAHAPPHPQHRWTRRSQSFSLTSRSPTFDSTDFRLLLNGVDGMTRRRSFSSIDAGLLDHQIPSHRLGSPWFSEHGGAYLEGSLHNSMYTATTVDAASPRLSPADYDRLFPAPPGARYPSLYSWSAMDSSAYAQAASARSSITGAITLYLFDKLELKADDPSLVRYHQATGKILAATPARLIAQITSPQFLDYELLADFFLSFRCFMTCRDVLEYLFARMHWAFVSGTDAGRIVRVRTFVALRHWILNYFADDFLSDPRFRQRFCDLVNDLARTLRQRPDQGGSDMNILRELKKCWRRTSVLYWPVPDGVKQLPDDKITRGGNETLRPASNVGFPFIARPTSQRASIFEMAQVQLVDWDRPLNGGVGVHTTEALRHDRPSDYRVRTASIPASPMSEESLDVLSCSVPFLRNMRNAPVAMAKKDAAQSSQSSAVSTKPSTQVNQSFHRHKRSGSFSDALRDVRAPAQNTPPEVPDSQDLPHNALTGALIRGLILQPSPGMIRTSLPLTPVSAPLKHQRFPSIEEAIVEDRQSSSTHSGVKRIVGDMRRAFSNRRTYSDYPAVGRQSDSSSESRISNTPPSSFERTLPPSQQVVGPPRQDLLAARVKGKYEDAKARAEHRQLDARQPTLGHHENATFLHKPSQTPERDREARLHSQVTNSSQSIWIVDATRDSTRPHGSAVLPSLSSFSSGMTPMPLFRNKSELMEYALPERPTLSVPQTRSASRASSWRLSDTRLHDLVHAHTTSKRESPSRSPSRSRSVNWALRRSSAALSPDLIASPFRHQLRRRPGGDLKNADSVRDLHHGLRAVPADRRASDVGDDKAGSAGMHFADQALGILWPFRSRFSRALSTRKSLDLLERSSSQPKVRKSFEAEALRLKGLPDFDTAGGIEDTLMRLEGKTPTGPEPPKFRYDVTAVDSVTDGLAKNRPHNDSTLLPAPDSQGVSPHGANVQSIASTDSEPPRMTARISKLSSGDHYPAPSTESFDDAGGEGNAEHASETARPIQNGTLRPPDARGSFLVDDNESLSDISTDIADNPADEEAIRSFLSGDTHGVISVASDLSKPPTIRYSSSGVLSGQALPPMSPTRHATFAKDQSSKDTLPAPKPNSSLAKASLRPQMDNAKVAKTLVEAPPPLTHMPFVLAFESEVIAEQLTIIEKDALDEVDWKDLMTLSWRQTPTHVRDWVDYLSGAEPNGIDLVIARFNLVVKWVISEVVLTEATSERARAIAKYVHVAMHARRLRNYASMYQITLALLSSDLARLHRTWSLVPAREKRLLEQLEALCRPLRNFHNLRAEMETASLDNGCIPFIGLYTHDLMINAQKPARYEPEVAVTGKTEPLMNFERYQTAATVVKSLLRLIEASGKYVFKPEPEVLSRCLWLAALGDDELEQRFAALDET